MNFIDFIQLKKILIMFFAVQVDVVEGMQFSYTPMELLNKPIQLVIVVPYDPLWKVYFAMEYDNLRKVFDKSHLRAIEHYGSTSVDGMWAKPFIDIIVGLSDFCLAAEELFGLQKLGYEFVENSTYCQRYYLRKRSECICFNLSIVPYKSKTWNRCIAFRDYLKGDSESRKKYVEMKKEAIAKGHNFLPDYSRYKMSFIAELERIIELRNAK